MPLPYYFNHDMWLRMNGVAPVYLEPDADLVPRAADAESLITPRTRAIVLVTPGNPSGVTIAAGGDRRLRRGRAPPRCRADPRRDVPLVPGHPANRPTPCSPTQTGARPWSACTRFSKDLAIPGYRVGCVVASPELNREVLKLMDCVAICSPRIGQEAALAGLTRAGSGERRGPPRSRGTGRGWARPWPPGRAGSSCLAAAGSSPGSGIRSPTGRPPTSCGTSSFAHDTLVIPGTAFLPDDRRMLRISAGRVDEAAAAVLAARLTAAGR